MVANMMSKLRSEHEIMKCWSGQRDIVVSISCITYNHEMYIAECLNSLINQKFDHPFEILINDDCSTDNTKNIIEKYASTYPNIIKAIYQTENQMSRDIYQSMHGKYNVKRAVGKYVFFCDGDDFWIDDEKLRKQTEVLEQTDAKLCFHSCYQLSKGSYSLFNPYGQKKRSISFVQKFRDGSDTCPSASIAIERSYLMSAEDHISEFIENILSHSFIQYWGCLEKNGIYLPNAMSVYRKNIEGSWTKKIQDRKLGKRYQKRNIEYLLKFTKLVAFPKSLIVWRRIIRLTFTYCLKQILLK